MAAMTSFRTELCCHLVNVHTASSQQSIYAAVPRGGSSVLSWQSSNFWGSWRSGGCSPSRVQGQSP